MKCSYLASRIIATSLVVILAACVSNADGQLSFYYDTLTGNVSFDTSETSTGQAIGYGFRIDEGHSDVRFNLDEWITLSASSLVDEMPTQIAEVTFGQPWSGLFTIGDVLPAGLTAEEWSGLFEGSGEASYRDAAGQGTPPEALLVYGRPEGEFDNQDDLLDPDTLTWATEASLIFREQDAHIILDTTGNEGGYTTAFALQTDGLPVDEEALTLPSTFGLSEVDENQVGYFTDVLEPGRYDLGSFLGADLTGSEFLGGFSEASFLGRVGFGRRDLDLSTDGITFSLSIQTAAVPEPASSIVLAIALAACCSRRRRS